MCLPPAQWELFSLSNPTAPIQRIIIQPIAAQGRRLHLGNQDFSYPGKDIHDPMGFTF
jgi:hypothetical protein